MDAGQFARRSPGRLPWDIGPATFFYRRDLFEQVCRPPSDPESVAELTSTWPGFLDVAKKLTNPDEQRWAMGSASDILTPTSPIATCLMPTGIVRSITNVPSSCSPTPRRRAAGVDAKVSNWSAEWQTMLGNDSIAMQYGGAWFGGFLKGWLQPEGAQWEGKWGIFEVPEDPGQNWGGSFLAIPEQSENKEAAWKFIEFALANKDSQNKMFAAVDYFPAYIPAFDDPMYGEADPFFGGQKTREMWVDIAANKIQPFITTPMDAGRADLHVLRQQRRSTRV